MKTRYITQCPKHGQESKDWAGKQIVVPQPLTKKTRRDGGCPTCKAELLKNA
jgi:hypothetical protein